MERIELTMKDAAEAVTDVLKAKRVPFLLSPPGIGKSDLAKQLAAGFNLHVIDERLSDNDPADLKGYPFVLNPNEEMRTKIRAGHIPMETFPIEGDEIPEGRKGWLVLLDEFNSAPLSVQAAAYKIVLDRMVGRHHMHKKCAVIAAGNRMEDRAIVNRIGTAMQTRLVWLPLKVCPEAWMIWANSHNVDYRVKAFINFREDLLHNFDPDHEDLTFPCPRTWEFLSDIIKPWSDIPLKKLPTVAGTVGVGAGREFQGFSEIFGHIPTFDEIVQNPRTVDFGDEPSMHYALAAMISHRMDEITADACVDFIDRLDIDYQVITLKAAIVKNRQIKKSQNVSRWLASNANEMSDIL